MQQEATCHFADRASAIRYYREYGNDDEEVDRKIRDQEVVIGPPDHVPGATIVSLAGHYHRRYADEIQQSPTTNK